MTILSNINDINPTQWEALLQTSPTASWFQSKEAYDFYASLPEIFEPFVFAVAEADELKGVCVSYITQEHSKIKQYFTRRAIIIGGPLLADNVTQEEVTALMQTVRNALKHKAIYIETRNFSSYEQYKVAFQQAGFDYNPHYDLHLDCTDRDQMFARMQDRKTRKIKSLLVEGHEIAEAATAQEVHDFYILLNALYKTKVKTPLFPEAFFQTFVKNNIGKLLLVKKDNQVEGGILCPILKIHTDQATAEQPNLSVIYEWFVVGDILSTWAAIDYANTHGIAKADFMGAGEPNIPYGVRDFKLAMGGTLHEFGRFLSINNRILYTFGTIGVRLIKSLNL